MAKDEDTKETIEERTHDEWFQPPEGPTKAYKNAEFLDSPTARPLCDEAHAWIASARGFPATRIRD